MDTSLRNIRRDLTCPFIICLSLLLNVANPDTVSAQDAYYKKNGRYKLKYHTTSHKFLQMEESVAEYTLQQKIDSFDRKYRLLDEVIDAAKIRLVPLAQPDIKSTDDAETIFRTIDSVLVEHNFIICIKVEKLSDALSPKKLPNFDCAPYLTGYRAAYCSENEEADFYGIDCDLGAMIYLSIGEVLHFPLAVAESRDHNFIRWRFSDNTYLNWDNNAVRSYTDDVYRNGNSATSSVSYSRKEEAANHYLEDMSRSQLNGYYHGLVGAFLESQGRYSEAEKHFQKAIHARPYDAVALNNLSWMYLTAGKFKGKRHYKKAYSLSASADKLNNDDANFKDTYSCACAANGNFTKAIEIEKMALNRPGKMAGFLAGKTCLEMGIK